MLFHFLAAQIQPRNLKDKFLMPLNCFTFMATDYLGVYALQQIARIFTTET